MFVKKYFPLCIKFIVIFILFVAYIDVNNFVNANSINQSKKNLLDYKNVNSSDTVYSHKLFSYYLRALHAETNNDFLSAAKFYTESLAIDSANLELIEASFSNLYATGQITTAAEIAQHAESLNLNLIMGVEPALAIATKDADWEAVLALSETAMLEGSSQYMGYLLRAWALYNLEQKSAAISIFENLFKLLEQQGFSDPNFINLFIAQLFILEEEYPQAISHLSKITLNRNSNPELIIATSEAHAFLGNVTTAKALSQNLSQNYNQDALEAWFEQKSTVKISQKHIGYFIAQSIVHLNLFTLTEETIDYLKHRSQFGLFLAESYGYSLPSASLTLLQLSNEESDLEDTKYRFQSIPKKDPRFQISLMLYLSKLRQDNEITSAIEILQLYLDENQNLLILEEMLADFFRIEDQCRNAIKRYEKVSKIKSNGGDIYRKLGICYEKTGQNTKAEAAFKRALEINPNDSSALNYLGYWWADEGRNLEKAMELIIKAVELYPDNGYYADSLGWVYFKIGETKKAVDWLEHAVQLAPEDAVIHEHLGDVYWHLGRPLEARYKWQFAFEMYTDKLAKKLVSDKINVGLLEE